MKRLPIYLGLALAFLFNGCEMEEQFNESPRRNFEAFWKLLDENYCFFDYKHVDWDAIYDKYSPLVSDSIEQQELFQTLSLMANELQDGHINITSFYSFSAYEGWYSAYPSNFNWSTVQAYLDGSERSGYYDEVRYKPLAEGRIGYIYYGSFSESLLEAELNKIFDAFKDCEGLVIDVRNNGGGSLTNSDRLASRFTGRRVLCGYIQHKTGKGHSSFSEPYPIYLESSGNQLWLKPVIVLTNRRSYSAANNFVSKMHILPHVQTLGDTTGGGSGFPFTSELPNGWRIRFSASPILDINKEHTEFGIAPDIKITLDPKDEEKRKDTLIETAVQLLLGK
ncbi:peptidase S41 [Bacteroidia bacterium]|nr:peptidase S41 [Bacteroidia bacterium]